VSLRTGLSVCFEVLTFRPCVLGWAVGYSIAFAPGNGLFGNPLTHLFHKDVLVQPVGALPALLVSLFQLLFCATVGAITVGGFCERGRLVAVVPFVVLWATFVYCPITHAVWGGGFLGEMGVLDFAGGTPVHICSGASATAISVYLSYPQFRSRRSASRSPQHLALHKPHNTMSQLLALVAIWGGWLAFEAGTAMELNFTAVFTMFTTNLCAASGAATWSLLNYYLTGLWSLDAFFLGAISGLVMITPSSAFISVTTAFFFGVFGALLCHTALRFKSTDLARRLRWVDNGDTFATHCCGGFAGTLMTGLFASKEVAAYSGLKVAGGAVFDGNWGQLGIQATEALVGFTWAFVGSWCIIALIDCVPGLEVLARDEDVVVGMDKSQMDESFYEAQWDGEEDYHPFAKGAVEI
jgi:ammonia channel protein AmtB